ncbi:MAG TPA: hypothetical protein VFG20_02815 [Planctomycetaceae bacterium]|nr:hypothetical protein [Planctomycetaceae bacterium]
MTSLTQQKSYWQVRRVIEMTADLAEIALPWAESAVEITDSSLFELWDDGRQLTADWQRRLDLLKSAPGRSLSLEQDLLLAALTYEVLAIEIPTRLVATICAVIDRQRKRPEYRPIAEPVLFSLQHVRHQLLTRILENGDRSAALDRYRRRCERWTDLLLGPLVVRFGAAAFAQDARRSWEFGEDLLADTTLEVSQHLIRPSLLAAFQGPAGQSPIQSESGAPFLQSLLSIVPESRRGERLQRWFTELTDMPTILPFRPAAPSSPDDESASWSLLDRCLKIADWRRARDR